MREQRDHVLLAHVRQTVGEHVLFPTADGLEHALGGLVDGRAGWHVRQIGNSQLGWPLRMLSIGDGPRHALIIAGVHANEPIGFHTLLALAGLLSEAPAWAAGWTWHLVLVFDPDAVRRNRWYRRRPLTFRSYHEGFFRQGPGGSPLFRFPVRGAQRPFEHPEPETRALMRVIDDVRPDLVFELHNCDFGGAFFIVNRRAAGLGDELRAVLKRAKLPLERTPSDPQIATWNQDSPGVFIAPPIDATVAATGAEGAPLRDYLPSEARWFGPEVPLFRTSIPRAPADGIRQAVTDLADELERVAGTIADTIAATEGDLTQRTPFPPSQADLDAQRRAAERLRSKSHDVSAADAYIGACYLLHTARLRFGALLRRTLDAEICAGNVTPAIHNAKTDLEHQLDDWYAACEQALRPRPFPIEVPVYAQLETILIAARHVNETHP